MSLFLTVHSLKNFKLTVTCIVKVQKLKHYSFLILATRTNTTRDKTALRYALQRQNTEISKQIFPEKEYRGISPNFHIHASLSDLYIPTIGLPILLEEICRPILGLYKSLTDT
jgi:hypothetical protein